MPHPSTISTLGDEPASALAKRLVRAGLNPPKPAEPIYARFGTWVAVQRKALGLTQADLAQRMNLSRASIANIETGRQRVLMHDVLALMVICGAERQAYSFADMLATAPARKERAA